MILKILMLEDFNVDADLIKRQLKKDHLEFISEQVDTKEEFEKAIKEFRPHIILSDHSLPQFNSIAALKIAKEELPHVPFILVTGSVSEEFAVSCIKAGASDYILKSNLARLASAIKSSLEKTKLTTEYNFIKKLNDEIELKNEELRYLNQEKDRFVGMVSHDLQNYVSTMTYTLSIINKDTDSLNETQHNSIKKLERTTGNMHKLLNDFLIVNRIHNGIIQPLYNLVNLGALVGEIIEGSEDIAARKNIKIHYTNKYADAFFRTDASYVGIIVENLISNALKYSPPDKVVEIKVGKKDGNPYFEVKDHGPGIPASDIPKMYIRFQKLTPKPTAGEPSNGLGLSIVRDLTNALKAKIECLTEVGKGTTFTVLF